MKITGINSLYRERAKMAYLFDKVHLWARKKISFILPFSCILLNLSLIRSTEMSVFPDPGHNYIYERFSEVGLLSITEQNAE